MAGTRVARRDSHSGAKLAGQAGEGGEGSALGLSRGSVVGQGRHAGCQNGRARHTHSIAHCRTCTRTNHTPSVPGDKHTDTPPTVLRHNRTCRHKAGRHARVMGGQKKQNVRVNNEALFFLSLVLTKIKCFHEASTFLKQQRSMGENQQPHACSKGIYIQVDVSHRLVLGAVRTDPLPTDSKRRPQCSCIHSRPLKQCPTSNRGECNCREVRRIYSRQSVIFISISHTHKKAPTTSKQHLKDNYHIHTKAQLMLTNAQHFGSESPMYC